MNCDRCRAATKATIDVVCLWGSRGFCDCQETPHRQCVTCAEWTKSEALEEAKYEALEEVEE